MTRRCLVRALMLVCVMLALLLGSTRLDAQTGCSPNPTPFTDLGNMSSVFCQAVTAAYITGIANGTSATTYSPGLNVTRDQMAAFATRTLDQAVKRGNRRVALNRMWSAKSYQSGLVTIFLARLHRVQSDGADLWVSGDQDLWRFRGSDGKFLQRQNLPAGVQGRGVLVVGNYVMVAGYISPGTLPGRLYYHSETNAELTEFPTAGPLPVLLDGLAFDGENIWIGSGSGAIARINFQIFNPGPAVTTITGFSQPRNVIYDGANIWVSEFGSDKVHKLDAAGAILQTVTVGLNPLTMAFDGTNLWVPNYGSNSISVVRAVGSQAGTVLATLTGNGLDTPSAAAFDGERVLVTNENAHSVSVFRAADLTPLGSSTVSDFSPVGVCSDGINFWITNVRSNIGSQGALFRY